MSDRFLRAFVIVALTAAATSCGSNNPAQPSAGGSALTSSIVAPRPVTPSNSAQIRNSDQPVTLAVQNAVSTKPGVAYLFEVATDAAFTTKVQTKDAVAEGTGGQTSVKLDALAAAKDYYWHARASGGGTTGVFGTMYKFSVGPAIVLNPPIAVRPASGAQTGGRPSLTVTNATKQGPAGAITYKFEISASAAFTPILVSGTVPETAGQTTFTPPTDLAANTTLFWRVTAIDAINGITSAPSTAQSFVTSFAIDLSKVVFLHSPDVSNWPQTGTLILVEQDGAAPGPMCMTFTDPGWPDSHWPFPGPDPNFGVYGNQWYFANIGGTWYGGAGEWLYRGAATCKAGQGTTTIGPDSGFGQPFASWVPKPGELVGFMVSSVARNGPVQRTVDERTNVIVQPWHDSSLQGFSAGRAKR
jgi:hypothetical protein